jgi:hypothetical protein
MSNPNKVVANSWQTLLVSIFLGYYIQYSGRCSKPSIGFGVRPAGTVRSKFSDLSTTETLLAHPCSPFLVGSIGFGVHGRL